MADRDPFEGWAILELMGHRRIAGYIREAELAGGSFLRIDVLGADGTLGASQFYAPGAVYCITPTNEETVRELGMRWEPPVHHWQLPARVTAGDDEDDQEPTWE